MPHTKMTARFYIYRRIYYSIHVHFPPKCTYKTRIKDEPCTSTKRHIICKFYINAPRALRLWWFTAEKRFSWRCACNNIILLIHNKHQKSLSQNSNAARTIKSGRHICVECIGKFLLVKYIRLMKNIIQSCELKFIDLPVIYMPPHEIIIAAMVWIYYIL